MTNDRIRGRRAFLRAAGAAIPAALVPAAAAATPTDTPDTVAIGELYRDYAARLAAEAFEKLAGPSPEAVQLRLLQDPAQPADRIVISADGKSAMAEFHCLVETAAPLAGEAPFLMMARLQGLHGGAWWETGIHELDCVKAADGWKIRGATYRRTAQAPHAAYHGLDR